MSANKNTTPAKDKVVSKTAIGQYESIEDFTKNGLATIMQTIQSVNALPTGSSRDAYCAYPSYGKVIDLESSRILGLISRVLDKQNIRGNILRRQEDEQFEMLLECNDLMLENINSNLDELAGIKKNPQTILVESKMSTVARPNAGSWNNNKTTLPELNSSVRLIAAKNIARPQVNFKIPVDNNPNTVFQPLLTDKPHSLKPLAILPEYDEDGNIESYLHPYEFELDKFEVNASMLTTRDPIIFPKSTEETELIYIDSEKLLKETLENLRNATEIAIDLEHHSYRSFQGITCLMQISTSEKDYIIDTLRLREELYILNNVFANPKILKIFHGADCDIDWLQRDLSLYIVNMFDTHQAAKILGFPRLSLAYLLKNYCNIEADKTLQLADWRIRPLPEELIKYARQDTHFLIYIYKSLQNELLLKANNQTNLVKTVYERSTELCKKRYVKPKFHENSHTEMYRKSKRNFDNRQIFALEEIYLWRDRLARKEDESYGYVLPNHMMLQISESLPREMQGILACCNPIPPLVRQHLNTIHQIILKAREQPLVKAFDSEQILNRIAVRSNKDSKLFCSHDFSHDPEFRDDLPTLLGPIFETEEKPVTFSLAKPALQVFEIYKPSENKIIQEKLLKLKKLKFVSPYERYKAIIPVAEKEKLDELARKQTENVITVCTIKTETIEIAAPATSDNNDNRSVPLKNAINRKRNKRNTTESELEVQTKKSKIEETDDDHLHFVPKQPKNVAPDSAKKGNFKFPINVGAHNSKGESNSRQNTNQCEPSTSRSNGKNARKKHKPFNGKQNSNTPVQFDYKTVDYKKFVGGSQRAKTAELQSKYQGKGKGNKANQKKFNKLFTFSNNKKK